MGENTKIEWCDHTWNPWFGCTKVSPACDHCYAEAMMDARYGKVEWGAGNDRKRTSLANWREPYRWDTKARATGKIETVFCLSLGDIWDNEVDPLWRRDAFKVMTETPNLLYLLLSKRIGNAVKMCDPMAANPLLPPNAALGATLINQEEWDRDMPKLKRAAEVLGARFTFASVEPMLGPIDARGQLPDWVIVGGESGRHARPMHPDWSRSMRDQCASAGAAFLFKQHGEWSPLAPTRSDGSLDFSGAHALADDGTLYKAMDLAYPDGPRRGEAIRADHDKAHLTSMYRVGKKVAGRLLDGVEHNGFPS